ncbi:MAG: hypothetical protein Q4B06_04165 [Candidatus Saccharibacteria bacterium]|nr:hypothetical protein [Candidatus Saccharibacteria bacterium]
MKLTRTKRTLRHFLVAALIATGFSAVITTTQTFAEEKSCGGVKTAVISCKSSEDDTTGEGIFEILKIVIRVMVVGVGIVAVGGIGYGAVLYASAQDSAAQIQQARTIIRNVVIGLIAFALMTVFLNFIIPGGVIS